MYYEEKEIEGVLVCRHSPTAEWVEVKSLSGSELYFKLRRAADNFEPDWVNTVDALEKIRNQYGFSITEFAELLDMRPNQYSSFKKRSILLPKKCVLRAVAIGCPVESLLDNFLLKV